MHTFLDSIGFSSYALGLVPILLARTWRARRVAFLFGLASIGFGAWYISGNSSGSSAQDGIRRIGLPIIGALFTALTSVIVTYGLDRKRHTRH